MVFKNAPKNPLCTKKVQETFLILKLDIITVILTPYTCMSGGECMGGLSGPRTMLSVSRFWTEWSYQLPGIKSIDSDVPVRSPANIRSYESGVGSLLWNIQQQKKGLGIWMTCSLFQLKYRCWVILKKTNKAVTSRTEVRAKDKARYAIIWNNGP